MQPGEETQIKMAFSMHDGMGGPHLFQIALRTNDPVEPEKVLSVRANIGDFGGIPPATPVPKRG